MSEIDHSRAAAIDLKPPLMGAIATVDLLIVTFESILHRAEMSPISDLSEYQAINAFDSY